MLFLFLIPFVVTSQMIYGVTQEQKDKALKAVARELCFVWGGKTFSHAQQTDAAFCRRYISAGFGIKLVTHLVLKEIYKSVGWHDEHKKSKSEKKPKENNVLRQTNTFDALMKEGGKFIKSGSGRYVLETTANTVALQTLFCNSNKKELALQGANFVIFTIAAEVAAGYLCESLQIKRNSNKAKFLYMVVRFISCFGIRAIETLI